MLLKLNIFFIPFLIRSQVPHLDSNSVFVELANEIHGGMARHIGPLPGGHHLSTVLVVIRVVGLPFFPFAEGGHGGAIHVGEFAFSVKVVNADVNSAQACVGYTSRNGCIGAVVLWHGQVPSPRLTVDLCVGVALCFLHQQIDLTLCLFHASNSCRGGQG